MSRHSLYWWCRSLIQSLLRHRKAQCRGGKKATLFLNRLFQVETSLCSCVFHNGWTVFFSIRDIKSQVIPSSTVDESASRRHALCWALIQGSLANYSSSPPRMASDIWCYVDLLRLRFWWTPAEQSSQRHNTVFLLFNLCSQLFSFLLVPQQKVVQLSLHLLLWAEKTSLRCQQTEFCALELKMFSYLVNLTVVGTKTRPALVFNQFFGMENSIFRNMSCIFKLLCIP